MDCELLPVVLFLKLAVFFIPHFPSVPSVQQFSSWSVPIFLAISLFTDLNKIGNRNKNQLACVFLWRRMIISVQLLCILCNPLEVFIFWVTCLWIVRQTKPSCLFFRSCVRCHGFCTCVAAKLLELWPLLLHIKCRFVSRLHEINAQAIIEFGRVVVPALLLNCLSTSFERCTSCYMLCWAHVLLLTDLYTADRLISGHWEPKQLWLNGPLTEIVVLWFEREVWCKGICSVTCY